MLIWKYRVMLPMNQTDHNTHQKCQLNTIHTITQVSNISQQEHDNMQWYHIKHQ